MDRSVLDWLNQLTEKEKTIVLKNDAKATSIHISLPQLLKSNYNR